LQKKYKAKGFKVVSVSLDEGSTSVVKKFVAKMKPAFKVVHDPTLKSAEIYGVSGIPANYVIGRDGKVIAVAGYDLPALQKATARAIADAGARASR
jgi:peroxiredoxin